VAVADIFYRLHVTHARVALRAFAAEYRLAMFRMGLDTAHLQEAIDNWGESFRTLGLAAGAAGGAIAGAAWLAYRATSAYQANLMRLTYYITTMGVESEEASRMAREMAEAVEEASIRFAYSSEVALEGMVELVRVGYEYEEMMNMIVPLTALAASSQIEFSEAVRILTGFIKGFRLPAEEAGYILDVLRVAADESVLVFEELATGIEKGAATAYMAGITFEEFAAMLAAASEVMMATGTTGRGLVRIITELLANAEDLTASWDRITEALGVSVPMFEEGRLNLTGLIEAAEVSIGDFEVLATTFDELGIIGGRALAALLVASEEYIYILERVREAQGENIRFAEMWATSFEAQVVVMKEYIFQALRSEAVMRALSTILARLREVMPALSEAFASFIVRILERAPELLNALGQASEVLPSLLGAALLLLDEFLMILRTLIRILGFLAPAVGPLIFLFVQIKVIVPILNILFYTLLLRVHGVSSSFFILHGAMMAAVGGAALVSIALYQIEEGSKALGYVLLLFGGILITVASWMVGVKVASYALAAAKYMEAGGWIAATIASKAYLIGAAAAVAIAATLVAAIVMVHRRMSEFREEMETLAKVKTDDIGLTEMQIDAQRELNNELQRGTIAAGEYYDMMLLLLEETRGYIIALQMIPALPSPVATAPAPPVPMEYGGVVTRPTLALIGEVPEAVIPLHRMPVEREIRVEINIANLNIGAEYDVRRFSRDIGREVVRDLRRRAVIV